MSRDPQEESSSQAMDQRRHSGRMLDVIYNVVDVVGKLGPVAVIFAAIVGAYIANTFQRQISGTTLLSEREQAESQLRASMFSSLIEPIVGPQKGARILLDREQLLVELLALNFHEHFELKPLFERVDERLIAEGLKKGMSRKEIERERERLRSIARRIIDRQIAMLQKEGGGGRSDGKGATVHLLVIVERPENEVQQGDIKVLQEKGYKVYELNRFINDLTSPDQKHRLAMAVTKPNWEKHEFKASIYRCPSLPDPCPPKSGNLPLLQPITPMWADLPLTDNTLFPDGNRFAVVVYRVSGPPEVSLNTAWLKFIWFPKDYYTPRERPLDQSYFLKLVGKK